VAFLFLFNSYELADVFILFSLHLCHLIVWMKMEITSGKISPALTTFYLFL